MMLRRLYCLLFGCWWLALTQALLAPTSTPSAKISRSRLKAQIQKIVRESKATAKSTLENQTLGKLLLELESTVSNKNDKLQSTTPTFDPKAVAGTWHVIHAPHIAFLSKLFARFAPIEYHLTKDLQMTSCVKYETTAGVGGDNDTSPAGWLCTSGYYSIEETNGNVKIVWDKIWWNVDRRDRPTPPDEGFSPKLIQQLGEIGFIEPLSFFPVKYVDETIAIFQFFGFTITAMRQPNPKPSVLVRKA